MARATQMLADTGHDALVLTAGVQGVQFEDDQDASFATNPHFAAWCPARGPNHVLVFYPGAPRPEDVLQLLYFSPDDFWHRHEPLGTPFWAEKHRGGPHFNISEVPTRDAAWKVLENLPASTVVIGNDTAYAQAKGFKVNCPFVTGRLNWYRRYKTPYEVACLSEANRLGSIGHHAALAAFEEGKSEYGIHMAYLQALGLSDGDLPYTAIVCLDQNASVLHYDGKAHTPGQRGVLLIDSGAQCHHYASDITRTYARAGAHPTFKDLLKAVDQCQQSLCQKVVVGTSYPDLNDEYHKMVGQILQENGLLTKGVNAQNAYEQGITPTFFPHGLGHMLGVKVHDVGGKQIDPQGSVFPKTFAGGKSKNLRLLGDLEEDMVVTIEPGFYFIETLLKQLKLNAQKSKLLNWQLVEELIPYGGIRIEDDVLVTAGASRNLTREYL
jgi:Xaa-Pro dipeptidase